MATEEKEDETEAMTETEEIEIPDFEDLLKVAGDIDDRTKSLWLEIYSNARDDRERVSVLYTDIFLQMKGNVQGHAIYGPLVTKYLEKMAKSNDQLLKLSEQAMAYRKSEGSISPDDLLDQIQGGDDD